MKLKEYFKAPEKHCPICLKEVIENKYNDNGLYCEHGNITYAINYEKDGSEDPFVSIKLNNNISISFWNKKLHIFQRIASYATQEVFSYSFDYRSCEKDLSEFDLNWVTMMLAFQ